MPLKDGLTSLEQTIVQTLNGWGLDDALAGVIAERILSRSVFWAVALPSGETLALMRLYAPLVQRQEVFLGNVLLNDFLFKALPRAIRQAGLGRAELILNDLENAYILWQGSGNLTAARAAYQAEVLAALPDLYFGSEDTARGIHGEVRGMLTFYKCNIEPFPTFIVPQAYLGQLLKIVGDWLQTLVAENGAESLAKAARLPVEVAESWRINVILSLLSFFYCRDGAEMQSFFTFLEQAMADGRLPANQVKATFGLLPDDGFNKDIFNERKKGEVLNFEALSRAVEWLLHQVAQAVGENRLADFAPQLGQHKMLALTPEELAVYLLDGVQIGYLAAVTPEKPSPLAKNLACRFCGAHLAVVEEKNILGGSGTGNRFNQSLKGVAQRFCLRCALSSYLATRRLGMHFDGIFPVPKLYNIIFHYGRHDDWELEAMQRQIDYILPGVTKERKPLPDMLTEFAEIRRYVAEAHGVALPQAESEADFWDSWEAGWEVVAQMEKNVKAEVIPLGSEAYRLLVFILPQLRSGSKESAQKRFSHSRLAIYTLLGLLRKLCGCDGPYYFQSLPRLAPAGFEVNTFYVNGQPVQADAALRRYGAIANFARRVVKFQKGHSILVDWTVLAEQLEQDPLGVFSEVLRDSPIRGGDDLLKARYRRLSNEFVPGMAVVNSAEYLQLFNHLQQFQKEIQSIEEV